jgi:hypothetical protein
MTRRRITPSTNLVFAPLMPSQGAPEIGDLLRRCTSRRRVDVDEQRDHVEYGILLVLGERGEAREDGFVRLRQKVLDRTTQLEPGQVLAARKLSSATATAASAASVTFGMSPRACSMSSHRAMH